MINIETTNLCLARCQICPRESYTQRLGSMELGLFRSIVDSCCSLGIKVFDLCGYGDPFIDRTLVEKLVYVKEKLPDSKIYISTTGILMKSDTYWAVARLVDTLKLSIYGMTKAVYAEAHGGIDFDTAMANINGFLEYPGRKLKKPWIVGLMVSTDANKGQVSDWIEYWEPKLDEVMVWKPHNWVGYRHYREIDRTAQRSCGRPLSGPLYVHVDGTVSVCCWDINRRLTIGNVKTQSIQEVMLSEERKRIQKAHTENNFVGLICRDCDQTNHDPANLIYSNKGRKIDCLTPNRLDLCAKDPSETHSNT